tara:strand:+ start:783 stop:1466 length:684 start_codon:yes stop_codon:yes gene_type:complete
MTEYTLSKNVLDIGLFTANLDDTLAFWNKELGLSSEEPVPYNDGLRQFRLPFRNTIIKVNCSQKNLTKPPTGYSELYLAVENISSPKTILNPDGELITLVPVGFKGIKETAIKVKVNNLKSHANFYENVMGFNRKNDRTFQIGDCLLFLDEIEEERFAGHWVNLGFRYLTLHVMKIDETFSNMVAAGAEVGEEPYAIGDIAKISFLKDPDGNWIEVAQRASLAGPWD